MRSLVECGPVALALALVAGCQSLPVSSPSPAGQVSSLAADGGVLMAAASKAPGRCGPARGVLHQFRGEDDVKNWPSNLNLPTPERAHTRAAVTAPGYLVPYDRASMKVEIRPGDPQWEIDRGKGPKRRAEFSWKSWRFKGGREGWAGAAFYLPSDPMGTNKGTAIFQLHNYPEEGVLWNLYTWDGSLRSTNEPMGDVMNIDIRPYLDKWTRMVVHFKPTTGRGGFIRMWLNDELVLDVRGPTKPSGKDGPYFKHGTYFWGYEKFDDDKRAIAYFDNLRIGDQRASYGSVDPACW